MSSLIHPSAIIAEDAVIGKDVKIGPYCVIGPKVEIGDGTIMHSHVFVECNTKIGKNNVFFPFGSIGASPQDYSYKGEETRLEIGDGNTFRECVTINRGTMKEVGLTKIGNNSLIMAYVHIAHDVVIGDHCTIVNSVNVAGHVRIGDRVIIGGSSSVAQFVRLGRGAYIGGASAVDKDIPVFCTAYGNRIKLKGVNIVGMKRLNISREVISELVEFLRAMESSSLAPAVFISDSESMKPFVHNSIVKEMVEQIKTSEIGIAPFAT